MDQNAMAILICTKRFKTTYSLFLFFLLQIHTREKRIETTGKKQQWRI